MVNTIGAMLWSAENLVEDMIFAINLRNQIIAGEALQMLMLCVMQTIKYTCYKKRIEIMKPGGIRPLLVPNELIFAPAETRPAKLINDSKGNAYYLHSYLLIYS